MKVKHILISLTLIIAVVIGIILSQQPKYTNSSVTDAQDSNTTIVNSASKKFKDFVCEDLSPDSLGVAYNYEDLKSLVEFSLA